MTRFARAKGSKSSNERVPDEATPWSVMKMQLEDSQASSKAVKQKAKSAKELLAEKDEPFYHDSTGNVNHEWAEFDDVTESKSGKDKSGKLVKKMNGKTDKKKIKKAAKLHLKNDDSNNDRVAEVAEKVENINQSKRKVTNADEAQAAQTVHEIGSKTKKKKKSISNEGGSEIDSEKLVGRKKVDEDNVNDPCINSNANDTPADAKSNLKSKKRTKSSKKSKSSADADQLANQSENVISESQESQKHDLESIDSNEKKSPSSTVEGNSEKLSKRQKRNQKKQRKLISEQNESKVNVAEGDAQKDQNPKGFDVQGNDWSNEVKFGKQNTPRQPLAIDGDNPVDESKNLDKKMKKLNKKNINSENTGEGDEAPNANSNSDNLKIQNNNNTQSKKNQKRKGGKNDNKEYKRRKPDEGVVKMIMNGNEIEVVKYDGFPVKKEDAERLEELKKNMIIKGIPRSEINVAMKLERRKAEKALTRERKRVCFHCRKSGHNLSDCPELGRDEAGSGICFKCGSAEHTHFECRVIKGQEFRHASCFICREQGHIARQCPDNPKGLYPQGGGCKICGDVTHLKKDCPDLIKEKEETNVTADKIVGSKLESLQEDQQTDTKNDNIDIKPKNKIVKF